MVKVLNNPRYFNAIYQALLVIVIAQQIYFPQELRYMHLALLFIRMIISEVYASGYKQHKNEQFFIYAILATAVTSIVEKVFSVQLGLVYLLCLIIAVVIMITILNTIIVDSKAKLSLKKLHPKHIEMLQKGYKFTLGIFYALIGINVVTMFYALFEIMNLIN